MRCAQSESPLGQQRPSTQERQLWTGSISGLMSSDLEARVGAGFQAMASGDWAGARDEFVAVLEVDEVPEALLGLANALQGTNTPMRSDVDGRPHQFHPPQRPKPQPAALITSGPPNGVRSP